MLLVGPETDLDGAVALQKQSKISSCSINNLVAYKTQELPELLKEGPVILKSTGIVLAEETMCFRSAKYSLEEKTGLSREELSLRWKTAACLFVVEGTGEIGKLWE